MKHSTTALLLALGLASAPLATLAAQGPDIESSTRLTLKECMAMQEAKNDGASRSEMKKACDWTTDRNAESAVRSSKPRAADSYPYGVLPDKAVSQAPQPN